MRLFGRELLWREIPPPAAPAPNPAQPPGSGASDLRSARRRRGRVGPRSRIWDAAEQSRLTADWFTTPTTSDQDLMRQLRPLRARSREQVANNPYGRKFAHLLQSNVVGPIGIRLQVRAKDAGGQLLESLNAAVEDSWQQWSERKVDVTGRFTWWQVQSLFLRTMAVDGEALLRVRRGARWGRWGFAVQFLDPELLDPNHNEQLRDGRMIRMGVELDEYRAPVAYWFLDPTEHLDGSLARYGRKRIRVPASEVIHGFSSERVGQTRGAPWIATALLRLRMEGRYEEAALIAARIGASKMGFITSETGDGYKGDDEDTDGAVVQDVEPGTFEQLPSGMSVTPYNPEYPRGEFDPFIKALLRGISAGLLVSYPSLANDLQGVNYSSIRAGLLEDRDTWKMLQRLVASELCTRVYHGWLEAQLLTGTIEVAGSVLTPRDEMRLHRVQWHGRRWEWVDPLKEVAAHASAVEARFKSISQVIRDIGQDEPGDVFDEIAQERELLERLGIAATPKATPPAAKDDDDDEKEESEEKELEEVQG